MQMRCHCGLKSSKDTLSLYVKSAFLTVDFNVLQCLASSCQLLPLWLAFGIYQAHFCYWAPTPCSHSWSGLLPGLTSMFFNGLYFRGLLPDWPPQLPSVMWSPSSVYHLYGIQHLRGRNPVSLVSVIRIAWPVLKFGFSPLLSLILRLLLDFPVFSSLSCLTAA